MKYTIYTLLFIIKGWDLSMDEFKPIGKILWYIPFLLNNVITLLFRTLMFPFIWIGLYLYDHNQRLILRFFIYWMRSLSDIVEWETNH
jgi:hypothetical protein